MKNQELPTTGGKMPKAKRLNKKKTSNVIPIKKDVLEKEDQLMSIEEQEREEQINLRENYVMKLMIMLRSVKWMQI